MLSLVGLNVLTLWAIHDSTTLIMAIIKYIFKITIVKILHHNIIKNIIMIKTFWKILLIIILFLKELTFLFHSSEENKIANYNYRNKVICYLFINSFIKMCILTYNTCTVVLVRFNYLCKEKNINQPPSLINCNRNSCNKI